jgi:hypothetical protein
MSIKFGAEPIEFEKSKAGIVVPSKDKLPTVIDALIAAVRAGELTSCPAKRRRPAPSGRRARWLNHQRAGTGPKILLNLSPDPEHPTECRGFQGPVVSAAPPCKDIPLGGAVAVSDGTGRNPHTAVG